MCERQTYFAAIFIANTGADAKGWWWYFGQTPAQIGSLVQQHNARLIDLRQYQAGTGTTYAVVMVENTERISPGSVRVLKTVRQNEGLLRQAAEVRQGAR